MQGQFPLLQDQQFDADVFGAPVARLMQPERFSTDQADQWRLGGIWLVHCRIPADKDPMLSEKLLGAGFRQIETLVTLERDFANVRAVSDHVVDIAAIDDIAPCQDIARRAFTYSRYNRDPLIDQERAAVYKARWVENAIRGRADAAFVERRGTRARGFNFCLLNQDVAIIDLIAVDPVSQGEGIGKALIHHSLRHYKDRAACMRVGTQLENETSLAVYSSCGFREVSRAATYHWINCDAAP